MARTFADGLRLTFAGAVISATPLTMFAWVRPTTLAITHGLIGIGTSGSDNHRFSMEIHTGNVIRLTTRTTSNFFTDTTATVSVNTWEPICGVWPNNTSQHVYLRGANKVTTANAATPAGMNTTWIANDTGLAANREVNGQVAEAAFWSVALTDAEVMALATGVSPSHICPGSLVSYVPVWGYASPEPDLFGARLWTLTGSPAAANHAPVAPPIFGSYRPSGVSAGVAAYEQVAYRWRAAAGSLVAP